MKTTSEAWSDQLTAGVVAVYPVVELEFLYSARSLADRLEKQRLLPELLGWVAMHDGGWERARDVQQALTEADQHRSAGAADLADRGDRRAGTSGDLVRRPGLPGHRGRHGPARQDHHRDLIERYRFLSPGGQVYLIDGLCRRENQERAHDRTG